MIGTRSFDVFAAGAVSTAGITCPSGYTPSFDPNNPTAPGFCAPIRTTFSDVSLGDVLTNFAIGAVSTFTTGGLSVIGNTVAAGTTVALSELDVPSAQLIGGLTGSAVKLASGDLTWAPDVTDIYGGASMDDFGSFFDDFSFSDILPSSSTFSSLTSIAAPIIGAFTQPASNPIPSMYPGATQPQVYPTMGSIPMATRALAAGLPRWSAMFPTLWQFVRTKFPMMSPATAVSGLLSLLSKYGPTALASFVGAAVVSELLGYKVTKKRRRMNVANTRALRRSLRRLKGFNRLSHRVSAQLGRGGMRRGKSRCTTCRKSPCCC